jgi:hypothetical protein
MMRCECGPGSPALVVPLAADIPEIVIPVNAPSGASIGGAERESGLRHDPASRDRSGRDLVAVIIPAVEPVLHHGMTTIEHSFLNYTLGGEKPF